MGHFTGQYYYLCIVTPEDKDRLASVVENPQWFKLNSHSGVNRLVAGFVLRRVYGAVPGLKRAPDRHYFLVDRHRSTPGLWEDVRSEGKLSVECPDQPGFSLRDAGFELHMILPPKSKAR